MVTKGERTRHDILRVAVEQASQLGLEGLSIGALAHQTGMSKSGLFAHFGSKEELQIAVLDVARDLFTEHVVYPAIRQHPRGEPRVRALFDRWLAWMSAGTAAPATLRGALPGGCLFAATAWEFDDRPGPVRDHVRQNIGDLLLTIEKAADLAVGEGHFREDLDAAQFAFELYSLLLGFQIRSRLLGHDDAARRVTIAFDALLDRARRSS